MGGVVCVAFIIYNFASEADLRLIFLYVQLLGDLSRAQNAHRSSEFVTLVSEGRIFDPLPQVQSGEGEASPGYLTSIFNFIRVSLH